jgi:hypothetical protein
VALPAVDPGGDDLLPEWAPFHIYKMSSWSRRDADPLAIINHFKPTRELPEAQQLHELYPVGTSRRTSRCRDTAASSPGRISSSAAIAR